MVSQWKGILDSDIIPEGLHFFDNSAERDIEYKPIRKWRSISIFLYGSGMKKIPDIIKKIDQRRKKG